MYLPLGPFFSLTSMGFHARRGNRVPELVVELRWIKPLVGRDSKRAKGQAAVALKVHSNILYFLRV